MCLATNNEKTSEDSEKVKKPSTVYEAGNDYSTPVGISEEKRRLEKN